MVDRFRANSAGPLGPERLVVFALVVGLSLTTGCATTKLTSQATTVPPKEVREADRQPSENYKDLSLTQRVKVHLDLGRAHESQNDWQSALEEYQKGLQLVESSDNGFLDAKERTGLKALAHRRMGGALDRAGRFDQAAQQYQLALELAPKDPKVWNDLGYSQYLQGRWDEAEKSLRKGLKLDPKEPRLQTNLGLVLAAKGETDAAFDLLKKADGTASAHLALGYVLASTGKPEESKAQFEKALEAQPGLRPAALALTKLQANEAEATALAVESAPVIPDVIRTSLPAPPLDR